MSSPQSSALNTHSQGLEIQTVFERHQQGDIDFAKQGYEYFIDKQQYNANVCSNLAVIYMGENNFHKAEELLLEAVRLDSNHTLANFNLGNVLMVVERLEESAGYFEKVVSKNISLAGALCKYWHLKMKMCDWSEYPKMLKSLRKAINQVDQTDQPLDVINIVSPFSLLNIHDDLDLHLKASEQYAKYATGAIKPFTQITSRKNKEPNTVIKLGFLSADFYDHATSFLIAELFEIFDTETYEIHAISYGNLGKSSVMRKRIESSSGYFHDVSDQTDEAIANKISSLEIDIAIDLKGYTAESRPAILAYRPAPIQVNYLGYPGSMGASFIDYLIADPFIIPEESQSGYSEKIMYMPDSYQVNDRNRLISKQIPSRNECGLPEQGFVYCCFNHNYKITPELFDVWMELLDETPNSVLWLLESNQWAIQNLKAEAKLRGIESERIIFAKQIPMDAHLARIQNADLFLDTFPCNAHTTASDALWMGLPLITCSGKSFAARVAGSLLKAVNHDELITTNFTDYKKLAIKLANSPNELKAIKQSLIANRYTCSLFDTERFKNNLQKGFQLMIENNQSNEMPEDIVISDHKNPSSHTSIQETINTDKVMLVNMTLITPENTTLTEEFSKEESTHSTIVAVKKLYADLLALGFTPNVTENTMVDDGMNIIIGIEHLKEEDIQHLPDSVIIYNIETLSAETSWLSDTKLALFERYVTWDSSFNNISILYEKGIENKIHYVPYKLVNTLNNINYVNNALMNIGHKKEPSLELPFISIVTPSYNREAYIKDAINSALAQNYPQFEIIIVDDGSTDKTIEIVEQFSDPRVKLVKNEHSGGPGTRNKCIEEANGEYLVWLDSDDELMPDTLGHYASILQQHPGLDVIYGDLQSFDETGDKELFREVDLFGEQHLLNKMLPGCYLNHGASLVRKGLYSMFGGYNKDFRRAHDYEFWTRIAKFAQTKHSGTVVARWRWHDSNMSSGVEKIDTSYEAGVLKNSCARYSLKELYPLYDWTNPITAEVKAVFMTGTYLQDWGDYENAMLAYKRAEALSYEPDSTAIIQRLIHKLEELMNQGKENKKAELKSPLAFYDHSLSEQPLVSVIITCIDNTENLVDSLISLNEQTYQHCEAIVITSHESVVLDSEQKKIATHFNVSKDANLSEVLNNAIKSSNGEIICYLDNGKYLPEHIANIVNELKKEDADFVYTGTVLNNQNDQLQNLDYSKELLQVTNYIPMNTWGHRRDLLNKSGLFDSSLPLLQGWDLLLRFSQLTNFAQIQDNSIINIDCQEDDQTSEENIEDLQNLLPNIYKTIYNRYPSHDFNINKERIDLLEASGISYEPSVSTHKQPINYKILNEKVTAKVVISIPVYNEVKYIKETLSCLHQLPEGMDIKFFVTDNGSTDGSFEIIKAFAEKDNRFVIHQHAENLGAGYNFTYAYKQSESPYFMWLGAHDLINQSYIAKAVQILDNNEDVSIAAAEPYAFHDDISDAEFLTKAKYKLSKNRLTRYMQSVSNLDNCTVINSIFRRKCLDDVEFRTTRGNDMVWISHLLWYGNIAYIKDEKYYRRYFKEQRISSVERIVGTNEDTGLFPLIQYYVDDFKALHNKPGEVEDYLCTKLLGILEARFQLESFDA